MVTSLFCDGGVALKNPSRIAGSWACCAVDETDHRIHEAGGLILPETGLPPWPMTPDEMVQVTAERLIRSGR